jgi:capsid assembly protease
MQMTILDVLNSSWAIMPTRLLEIQGIYAAHMRDESIDIAAVEQRMGRQLANEHRSYEVRDGVAILPIEGVIAKRMNLFTQISGGASTQLLQRELGAALDDPEVHSIVLQIDSPGGTVDGTQTLANAVLAARDKKPIVTLASGTMASAAYWIGSAAQAAYIVDGTTSVGSIGVVTSHTDISGAEAARGIKTTEISAGKYKRIASQYAPLSEDGRQSIQDQLDYLYSLFVGAVAQHRGVSEEQVLADMADGRVFVGQRAVDAGLVDGITSLDDLVAKLAQEHGQAGAGISRQGVHSVKTSTHQPGKKTMNVEQLEQEHPAVAASLRAEGAASERARIQAVEQQLMPGHEALIAGMKFDGKSSGGDAAVAIVAAEKKSRETHAIASAADAPAPVASAPTASVQEPVAAELSREELDKRAKAHIASNPGVSYVDAYKAVGGK